MTYLYLVAIALAVITLLILLVPWIVLGIERYWSWCYNLQKSRRKS